MQKDDVARIAAELDAFLDSYRGDDWKENLFGPLVYRTPRKFWQRGWAKDQEMQRRLKSFGLPKLTREGRAMWHLQSGQLPSEDAGGYLRRKWMLALGVPYSDYRKHLTENRDENN